MNYKLCIKSCILDYAFFTNSVQGGLPYAHLKAVARFQLVYQPLGLRVLHVEDFAAFGAGKMNVIFAGRIIAKLVKRLVTSRLCDPLDFLFGFKLGQIAVDGTFADVFARQSLSDFCGRKGFVGIFGEKGEKSRPLLRVISHFKFLSQNSLQFKNCSQIIQIA